MNSISSDAYICTLPGGLRLVHRRVDSPVAYLGIMVGAGTRDELPEENGMAHYIEHCLFKGTTRRTSRQIIDRIENVGGEINAYTTKEETTFYAAVPVANTGLALELIADMIAHPTFPAAETAKERRVIYDEIESYNDSPSELIYDDFEQLVFAGHSLSMPILGTKRTLRYFGRDRAYAFLQRCYRPERMVVFVESSMPASRVQAWVERTVSPALASCVYAAPLFAPRDGYPASVARTAPATVAPSVADYHRHTHQAHVMLGGRAFPLGHPDQLTMYLLNHILGGGSMNSRLNLSLREQKGLVYTVESIYTPLSDTGYWSVYFASDPDNREECIRLVREQLRRLAERPLSPSALQRTLRQLHGQMAVSAENRENSVLSMAKLVLYHGEAPRWQDTFSRIAAITPDDLQRVAAEIFSSDNIFCLQYC